MRILWHSNAPFVGTGYGIQTSLFTNLAAKAGHQVFVSSLYGLRGARLKAGEMEILPGSYDEWGDDILAPHWEEIRPDVSVLLYDIWVYSKDSLTSFPITAWAPVDHDPIPEAVIRKLKLCRHTWAMSRFAERQMRKQGIDPFYVPHGVDTTVYKPLDDREGNREKMNLGGFDFIAVMVAANKGWPSRKSIDRVFKAWGKFIQTHPKSMLYMHSVWMEVNGGPDLKEMAEFYGITPKNIRFSDPYKMLMGDYLPRSVNLIYNAADVLLAPSAGEGFGVPVIEAQAAGCPVIVSDVTAQSELAGPGYKIPVDPFDGLAYTAAGSEQANILPSQILEALEWAWERRDDTKLREESRTFAMEYDARRIWERHMLPSLECMAAMNADMKVVYESA